MKKICFLYAVLKVYERKRRGANAVDPSKILPSVETKEGKAKIRQYIERQVEYYENNGCYIWKDSMRNQKTQWGSCSSNGNLNFNNRLLFVPEELVDYVVVHQLAHRKEMNHSNAFWNVVEKYMPDIRNAGKN